MKWALVVMVLGVAPVQTGLVFANLADCMAAEEAMQSSSAAAYGSWMQSELRDRRIYLPGWDDKEKRRKQAVGMLNQGTCIPHP